MGLSAPLALLAAALVALPVIAHLVRRADLDRRTLPTVAFLAKVVTRDKRRARVTEPWLLALRVTAVILAALALAGPFVTERLAYGDGSAVALAIVIDDSQSMAQRTAARTTAFEAALARAREIVRALGEGSEVAVVLAGEPARLAVPRTEDRETALRVLDGLRVGARGNDLPGAVELAARQLGAARLADRRTLVLSDFAGAEPLAPGRADVELVPVGPAEAPFNVGVAEVSATADPLEPDGWSIAVELASSGEAPASVVVALTTPPEPGAPTTELARTTVSLEDGRGRTSLRVRAPRELRRGAVRILDANDVLPDDDVRLVSLAPPTATRVVLVEPTATRTARFAARALAAVPTELGGFFVTILDADRLSGRRGAIDPGTTQPAPDLLESADVVVLAGAVPSSAAAVEALRRFAEGGGGLLFSPSSTTRAFDVAPIAELLPARVGEVEDVTMRSASLRPVSRARMTWLPPGPTGLEGLETRARLATAAEEDVVALRFADGEPLLVLDAASRRGVLAVGLDDVMSDLPLRAGFLPLLVSLLRALAPPGALPDHPFAGGRAPALRVGADVTEVEIVTPSGEVRSRAPRQGLVSLADLAEAGAYVLRVHDGTGVHELPRAALVIVAPATEIDLTPRLPEADTGESPAVARDGEVRSPVERWFYALVGLVALAEGFLRLRRPAARTAHG